MTQPAMMTDAELDEYRITARNLLDFARQQQREHDDETRALRERIGELEAIVDTLADHLVPGAVVAHAVH